MMRTHHPVSGSNPEEYWSGTLEMGEATFSIGGETLTTRAYRQAGGAFSIPGPTIHMVPGRKYVLRFHNTLPYEPRYSSTTCSRTRTSATCTPTVCTSRASPLETTYDVVASNCSVRFDLNTATSTPYEGRTIMHCHILAHEDQGAMGWLDVVGGAPPPTLPADTSVSQPYAVKYSLGGSGPMCGDNTCDAGEDSCSCAGDCGAPPSVETSCNDGVDEDCDGNTDCDDSDCSAAPECQTGSCDNDGVCEPGEDCTNCASDCDGVTTGRPSNRYCCGNGVAEGPEGDGTVCDDNY